MLYILGAIALLFLTYGLILFIKKGNKEFEAKLSLRERTELEKMLEKQAKEEAEEERKEGDKEKEISKPSEIVPKVKPIFPTKDIKAEINRYATHIEIDNLKVQHSIRNGVENFLNLDYKVALEEFSIATELNSKDVTGFYCRGLTKLQLRNFESALSDFTECINVKMKEPNAFYYPFGAKVVVIQLASLLTGKPPFTGEITVEAKLTDAQNGEVISAMMDRRVGVRKPIIGIFQSSTYDSWADVDEAIRYFAERVRRNRCVRRGGTGCIEPKE